jgi:hypothetical protein
MLQRKHPLIVSRAFSRSSRLARTFLSTNKGHLHHQEITAATMRHIIIITINFTILLRDYLEHYFLNISIQQIAFRFFFSLYYLFAYFAFTFE